MTLNPPTFTKINESFSCAHCRFQVPKSSSTCRDHCPKCLYSLHVDKNPGDRLAECGGVLQPVAWSQNKKKGYMIHYICQKCSMKKVNKFLQNDAIMPDDINTLIRLHSVT
ncbi:MAG: RNHCP domain-containing protein [Bdellovibrionota bacterium]